MSLQHNIGAYLKGAHALANTAQGATNEAEVDGTSLDRDALGTMYHSAKLVVAVQATLQSGTTVAVAANFQDSANDSDWTDYGTALASTVVGTGPAGDGEVEAVAELDVDLATADRYIRVQVTPLFSATDTDTGLFAGVVVFGGGAVLPAT
jgi:hypothetical protein